MNKNSKIYIAGHRGLVGSALMRRLQAKGYTNLITRTHAELDLTEQTGVHYCVNTAAKELDMQIRREGKDADEVGYLIPQFARYRARRPEECRA